MRRRALALLFGIAEVVAACSMDWSLPGDAGEGGATPPIDVGREGGTVLMDGTVASDGGADAPTDAMGDAITDVVAPPIDSDGKDTALPLGVPCGGTYRALDEV